MLLPLVESALPKNSVVREEFEWQRMTVPADVLLLLTAKERLAYLMVLLGKEVKEKKSFS